MTYEIFFLVYVIHLPIIIKMFHVLPQRLANDNLFDFFGFGLLTRNPLFLTNYISDFNKMVASKSGSIEFNPIFGVYQNDERNPTIYRSDLDKVCEATCNQTYPSEGLRELCISDCERTTRKITTFGLGLALIGMMFFAGIVYLLYVLYKKVSNSKW